MSVSWSNTSIGLSGGAGAGADAGGGGVEPSAARASAKVYGSATTLCGWIQRTAQPHSVDTCAGGTARPLREAVAAPAAAADEEEEEEAEAEAEAEEEVGAAEAEDEEDEADAGEDAGTEVDDEAEEATAEEAVEGGREALTADGRDGWGCAVLRMRVADGT
jgi:hypothetical protein